MKLIILAKISSVHTFGRLPLTPYMLSVFMEIL